MPPKAKTKNTDPAPDEGAKPDGAAIAPTAADAPPAAPAADEGAKPEPGECVVVLKKSAALGNGTRSKGETLCTIRRGEDGHLDFASAVAVEGVEQVEIDTAFNNLHLLDILSPVAEAGEE